MRMGGLLREPFILPHGKKVNNTSFVTCIYSFGWFYTQIVCCYFESKVHFLYAMIYVEIGMGRSIGGVPDESAPTVVPNTLLRGEALEKALECCRDLAAGFFQCAAVVYDFVYEGKARFVRGLGGEAGLSLFPAQAVTGHESR
jgi:hypothetical protein